MRSWNESRSGFLNETIPLFKWDGCDQRQLGDVGATARCALPGATIMLRSALELRQSTPTNKFPHSTTNVPVRGIVKPIRRLVKGNAIELNDVIIVDEKLIIDNKFFKDNYLKLSIGKKRHIKVELD